MRSAQARQSAKTAKTTARGLKAMAESRPCSKGSVCGVDGRRRYSICNLNPHCRDHWRSCVYQEFPERRAAECGYPAISGMPVNLEPRNMYQQVMQESGGMIGIQRCPYNTQYPNTPGAIQDADYSIKVGVQYYADCAEAGWKTGYGQAKT